jgi:hypothetical protein
VPANAFTAKTQRTQRNAKKSKEKKSKEKQRKILDVSLRFFASLRLCGEAVDLRLLIFPLPNEHA